MDTIPRLLASTFNTMYVIGGISQSTYFRSMERLAPEPQPNLYENTVGAESLSTLSPRTPSWNVLPTYMDLTPARAAHTIVLYRDHLYAVGGFETEKSTLVTSLQIFNGLFWDTLPSEANMFGRARHCAQVYRGAIYVMGGVVASPFGVTITKSVQYFNGTWTTAPAMAQPRWRASSVVFNDRIYVIGGLSVIGDLSVIALQDRATLSSVEVFDGAAWTTLEGNLTIGRFSASAVVFRGSIYLFGGQKARGSVADSAVASTDVFDGEKWTVVPFPLPAEMHAFSVCVFRNTLYLAGGQTFNGTDLADVYTSTTSPMSWTKVGSLNAPRRLASLIVYDMNGGV